MSHKSLDSDKSLMMVRIFFLSFFLFPFALLGAALSSDDYFLMILVDAPHLDYTNGKTLLKTIAKHPRDASKEGDVGHAWIYLHGKKGEKCWVLEGGHSGELGIVQEKYFDGVISAVDRQELNPVSYLWGTQKDGFFQKGAGGHTPTFAVKISLTSEQFRAILNSIHPSHYDYSNYAITGNQCVSFVVQVAQIAGVELEGEVSVPIPQNIYINCQQIVLWRDPQFSILTISTPDVLEKSLKALVREGKAEDALQWYLDHRVAKKCWKCRFQHFCRSARKFPYRMCRASQFG